MRIIEPYQLYGQRAKRKKRAKAKAILLLLLVASFCVGSYSVYVLYRSPPAIFPSYLLTTHEEQDSIKLSWPSYGQAALGATGYGVLGTSGNTSPTPTASIAKVMTALAVLKKHSLTPNQTGPTITLTAADVQLYRDYLARDGSVVPVLDGEQISLYQALQAILLPSGNNMADSLAIWAFGSLKEYLSYANRLASELGMHNTRFADDASGLSPNTVSTAQDLVKLGIAALEQPVLAQIVSQPAANIPVAGTIRNVNTLLGKGDIVGIKTGNTDQAGSCFLFAAAHTLNSNNRITMVGAVMGAQSLPVAFNDSLNLLQSGYANFTEQTVIRANETIAEYRVPWAKHVTVYAPRDIKSLIWRGKSIQPKIVLDPLKGVIKAKDQVGAVTVQNGRQQTLTPLLINSDVPLPSFWWRFTHPF